jgi:hypothetical protein
MFVSSFSFKFMVNFNVGSLHTVTVCLKFGEPRAARAVFRETDSIKLVYRGERERGERGT